MNYLPYIHRAQQWFLLSKRSGARVHGPVKKKTMRVWLVNMWRKTGTTSGERRKYRVPPGQTTRRAQPSRRWNCLWALVDNTTLGRRTRTGPERRFVRRHRRRESCGGSSYLYNRGILFAPLDKLVERKPGVLITIHGVENFVYPLYARDGVFSVISRGGPNKRHTFSGVSSSSGSLTIDPVIL